MKPLPSTKLRQRWWSRRSRRRGAFSRILRRTLYVKLGILAILGLGLGILYLRLGSGPLSFGHLPDRLASSIAARIGPGWNVALRNTALQLENGSLALRATGLDIRNPEGALVIQAPDAIVSVDGFSLLTGNLQPRSIEFRDLQLLATVNRDGSLSFAPNQEGGETAPKPDPLPPGGAAAVQPPPGIPNDASPVSLAVGSLLDVVVGPQGVIGTLDFARLTNARLSVVDSDRRTRAAFHRVNATFSRTESGGRRFNATLDGPQGAWNLSGDAVVDGDGYRAVIRAADAPVQDLLLLSGLSALPANTDLELSGQIEAVFANGRVSDLKARLSSNAGVIRIEDKDTSPLPVERSFIDASWAENRRTLVLERFELKGGDTRLRLSGELTAPADEPGWRAHLVGRDAALAGAAAGDPPVRIDEIRMELVGRDGVEIKSMHVNGPSATVDLTGTFGRAGDPRAMTLDVRAVNTDVRSALRFWPEASASNVRRFLVRSLKGGTVATIGVTVGFSGATLADANARRPIPDDSVRVEFKVDQGVLAVAEGLPPLTQAKVSGVVTGRTVTIRAPSALVLMGDGRSLPVSEGTFVIGDVWRDDALARIAFRLQGGADALSSLLQAPLIHDIAQIDLDPSSTKGRADLRIEIPLAVTNIPPIADLPILVSGTVSDLGVDRLFGKDRLEGANLAIAYDKGDMMIKGDGKIAGNPASIEVRQTRKAGGEANIAFTLDDAARARRGLSFGAQLAGPVLLKASVPLGMNPNPGTRIEADLAKATIDQLVPGWVKPAGKPAKLSFVLAEGVSAEIRDLQLDSGPMQIRGNAVLTAEGGLDKAELTTFKLSPGDDMRAQIERASNVYKVVVRGNVGDARPFTKSLGGNTSGGRSTTAGTKDSTAGTKDSRDFDLDLVLNILTGHNEEAITNASLKASVRKDTFRQLDMKGRLGATDLIAQTVPRPGASPSITVHSDDAGGVLRFLDIYRRMAGGRLSLQMTTGEGPQTGSLTLHDFAVRNEPALRRIIPTQSQVVAGRDQNGNPQSTRIDVNEVIFTKARLDFTRTAGRLDFKDAAIWGSHVGFTLGGYLDYARDRTDISGTFVPAYGLNNAFAQVPLFGPLLGGNQYEGLFAVNFRVSGPASAPVLAVNPLSAVAPGFLRRLFGAGAAPEIGSLPPDPLPER